MTEKNAAIYLLMIGICTLGGYVAGECVKHVESSFVAHQIQMYNGIFPGVHGQFDQIRWQEVHNIRLQLVTLATSIAGFIMGIQLVFRTHGSLFIAVSRAS